MDQTPINRPNAHDTEEDLLEFQRQFLESGLRPAVEVIKKRKNDPTAGISDDTSFETLKNRDIHVDAPKKSRLAETPQTIETGNVEAEMDANDNHITSILTKITERDTLQTPIYFPAPRTTAFPLLHHRLGQNAKQKQKSKKSIFAQQFRKQLEKEKQSSNNTSAEKLPVEPCGFTPLPKTIPMHQLQKLYPHSSIVSGTGLSSNNGADEGRKIHQENLERLSGMSEREAIEERNKLLQEISPETVEFLRGRSKLAKAGCKDMKVGESSLSEGKRSEQQESFDTSMDQNSPTVIEKELPTAKFLHMDVVETEKLAWTEEVPESSLKEVKSKHRFDFNGDIIEGGENIPTHLGLHHHGEDPTLPGYTLQELFILSRSKFTQQRVLAITMLGKIIAKAKAGLFIDLTSTNIIESLLDAGLLFLLRWSLDEQSETLLQAAIFSLHSLICDVRNEEALNHTFISDRGCEHPCLSPGVKISSESSDHDVAMVDVVAGLIRMKILPRLRYILEVGKPGPFVIGQCLDIIKRICQHSLQSAVAVYECSRLMGFVIRSLILNEGHYPQAVALVRSVCTAGRHVSTRLLNDYKDVVTIIYKYIGGCRANNDATNLHVEIEVWRLWITLMSYGLLPTTFRELFSVITKFLQLVTIKLRQQDQVSTHETFIYRAQLVCKMCSTALISPATMHPSSLKNLTDQIEIISQIVNKQMLQLSENSKVVGQLRVLFGSVLDYMTSYCQIMKNQSDVDITLITNFTSKTAIPMLNHALKYIKSTKFPKMILTREKKIAALPRIIGLLDPDCAHYFLLLVSYLRCSVSVISLDKSVCNNFGEAIMYLAENCHWMVENATVQTFLLRNRVYCLYWSTLLYLKLITDEPSENMKHSRFFFQVAFRCFSQLHDGDEHMMHHILSTVLFNTDLLKSLVEFSATVTDELAILDMSRMISAMAPSPGRILETMITTLPSIRATYLQSMTLDSKTMEKSKARYFHKFHEISSYLVPSCEGSCAPSDWTFIPLLQLYEYSLNKSLPAGSVMHSINCLRYLCFIERYCSDCLNGVSVSAKLVRIMCVYIAGNDLFLEHPVRECLAFLLSHYCRKSRHEDLDFKSPIPGISSFFDFYLSLLEQYESVSFGDELFGAVVLLPLHQLHGGIPDIKKALWCDRVDTLRLMGLPISKLLIPLSWYLYPIENDAFMIRSYLRALASGNCSLRRCPVLYTIAVHHTSGFLFDKNADIPVERRREIYNGVRKLKDEVVRKHILHYERPVSDDATSDMGFYFAEETSDARSADISFLKR